MERKLVEAWQIVEAIRRQIRIDNPNMPDDELKQIQISLPGFLAGLDQDGCNWTNYLPGTDHQNPIVDDAISKVRKVYNLRHE